MTTPDPARFTTDAAVPSSPTLKVMFRAEEPSDRTYILSCWNEGWKDAPENRDLLEPAEAKMLRDTAYDPDDLLRQTNAMTSRKYRKKFQELVVGGDGVLWHPRTKVMVGCSPEERGWIWAFCVFTPATKDEPAVIHWMTVRPNLRDGAGGKVLGDVWEIPRVAGTHRERAAGFPTQVPEALLTRVVLALTDEGDRVREYFTGSGSLARVCVRTARNYEGWEANATFAELAAMRVREAESEVRREKSSAARKNSAKG